MNTKHLNGKEVAVLLDAKAVVVDKNGLKKESVLATGFLSKNQPFFGFGKTLVFDYLSYCLQHPTWKKKGVECVDCINSTKTSVSKKYIIVIGLKEDEPTQETQHKDRGGGVLH